MALVRKAYRLKLDPNADQHYAFARFAGTCRWLWNKLLAMQQEQYQLDGTFIFFHDMSKLLPGLKAETPWLADAPSNSLVRVCKNLDRALRDSFKGTSARKQFPKFKAKHRSRDSFYIINQAMRIDSHHVILPKVGKVRFRASRLPEGRIVGATVSRTADDWYLTVQCEIEVDIAPVTPEVSTTIGGDLGIGASNLLVASDGVRVEAPRPLRKAQKRLRRAQRRLARCLKGSKNRDKQRRRLARIHQRVANIRTDATHKATRGIVDRASTLVCETLSVKGMMRSGRFGLSIADANLGETLRQFRYKCEWAGKTLIQADRFFASTQTCSACGAVKTRAEKLKLHQRTYRCACGHVADRDDNSAQNLRQYGLQRLFPDLAASRQSNVGRVTPERDERCSSDACGDPSAGPAASAAGRHGSLKQEVTRPSETQIP